MTITPLRLLLVSLSVFFVFYLTNASYESAPENSTHYQLNEGSFVSVKGPRFTIDPLYGLEGSPDGAVEISGPKLVALLGDCPGPRLSLPSNDALIGEVARSATDAAIPRLRCSAVAGLVSEDAEPADLAAPLVVAALAPSPAPRNREKAVTSPSPAASPKPAALHAKPAVLHTKPAALHAKPATSHAKKPASARHQHEKNLALARRWYKKRPRQAVTLLSTLLADKSVSNEIRAEAHYWKGKAHKELNEPQTALSELRAACKQAPHNPIFLNGLAWSLVTIRPRRFRDSEEALTLARRAVELTNRKRANYLDTLAKAFFSSGKAMEALMAQQEALAIDPDNKYFIRRYQRYQSAVTAD